MRSRLIGSVVTALGLIVTACSTDTSPTAPNIPVAAPQSPAPQLPVPGVIPPLPTGGSVQVAAFRMIEFQYPSSGRWHYAPQLTLVGPAEGLSDVITRITFEIPGLGRIPPCNAFLVLNSGQTMDLFTEIYGEYSFTIDQTGSRATSDIASAVLTLKDSRGTETTLAFSGKIVAGALPTTYTGGRPPFICS